MTETTMKDETMSELEPELIYQAELMGMTKRQNDLAKWFESRSKSGAIIDADQARCLEAATSLHRVYKLQNYLAGDGVGEQFRFSNGRLEIRYKGELGSFDDGQLTNLVIAAHALCVRVTVKPMSAMSIEIAFTAYNPETVSYDMFSYHPDLTHLTERIVKAGE